MTCCLIINHGANILRIFTEFRNHINFLIIGTKLITELKWITEEHPLIRVCRFQIWLHTSVWLLSSSGSAVWAITFGKHFDRGMYFWNSLMAQNTAGIRFTRGAQPWVWHRWEYLRISFSTSRHQRKSSCSKKSRKPLEFSRYRYFSSRTHWLSPRMCTFSFRRETIWIAEWMRPTDVYTTNWNQSELKNCAALNVTQIPDCFVLCLLFQFHYVFAVAVHADHNMDPVDIHLVRKRRNVLHEFDNKCNPSAARTLHMRVASRAHNLFAEKVVLFEAAVISRRLGRRNDLYQHSKSINRIRLHT